MGRKLSYTIADIATILIVAMFVSCGNEMKEVQDFLAEKNLPIGVASNVNLIHTDSGLVRTILISPVMHDYSNRKEHPYTLFPEGVKIISLDKAGDSIVLTADYTVTYSKTSISEVRGNVVVENLAENSKLMTSQLFWDSKEHYIYTEKDFTLITRYDTIFGKGFESNENLSKVNMKSIKGSVYVEETP